MHKKIPVAFQSNEERRDFFLILHYESLSIRSYCIVPHARMDMSHKSVSNISSNVRGESPVTLEESLL